MKDSGYFKICISHYFSENLVTPGIEPGPVDL
jgi:hypothetical protein